MSSPPIVNVVDARHRANRLTSVASWCFVVVVGAALLDGRLWGIGGIAAASAVLIGVLEIPMWKALASSASMSTRRAEALN